MTLLLIAVAGICSVIKIRNDSYWRGYNVGFSQGRIVGVNAFRVSRGMAADDSMPRRISLIKLDKGSAA